MRGVSDFLHRAGRHPFLLLLAATVLALLALGRSTGFEDLWSTADQRGRFLMERGKFTEAADEFVDPMWRGAALTKAGDFKTAAQVFGGMDNAMSAYDQGNALVMLGKYQEAVTRYDRALALQPGFPDAMANREIARLRAARMQAPGADAGDQREGADQIVYDKDAKSQEGQETTTEGGMHDAAIRAVWLKRVQTRPADFLRARFAVQLQATQAGAKPEAKP